MQLGLPPGVSVHVTHYSFGYSEDAPLSLCPRSWVLEGLIRDEEVWRTLRQHRDDRSLSDMRREATWEVQSARDECFTAVRIRLLDEEWATSSGRHAMVVRGMELFGTIRSARHTLRDVLALHHTAGPPTASLSRHGLAKDAGGTIQSEVMRRGDRGMRSSVQGGTSSELRSALRELQDDQKVGPVIKSALDLVQSRGSGGETLRQEQDQQQYKGASPTWLGDALRRAGQREVLSQTRLPFAD